MKKDPDAVGVFLRSKTYWLTHQRNNKRVRVTLETDNYAEAIKRARELRDAPELNEGGLLAHEIERFIKWKTDAGQFSRRTAENSSQFLSHLPRIVGNVVLFQVAEADAQRFYDTLRKRMTESSAQTYVAHARSLFRWLVKEAHVCRANPFDEIRLSELVSTARKEFCRPELRDKLIEECPRDDLKFILFCGFHAAFRKNEIVEARPCWFDVTAKTVTIRKIAPADAARSSLDPFDLKDQEERTIPLSKAFVAFLQR